ncbi:hypothetical protein F2Q69_00035955 [Brassica cretica]|uniref:RRM domain-containing protein n=2 Tax=Brassica TaxID=3705 RepID=A0A8S9SM71_BRACR|nr:hypothetical protein F2Q69_00035955 [Brassica cretica]
MCPVCPKLILMGFGRVVSPSFFCGPWQRLSFFQITETASPSAVSEDRKSDDLKIFFVGVLYSGYWSSSRVKDRFPYPVGYKTVRAHNGSTYYMEIEEGAKGPLFLNGAESYSIDSDTSDTSLEPSVLVATYEGTHDHLDQTLTLDMVHGVHVLALEKKKRGMMQEVDMFTSAQEKLHDWISRNPPITPLRRTMKLLFTPRFFSFLLLSRTNFRVTSLHQGYGFIEFFREEDADYAIKVLYISSMERLYVLPRQIKIKRA